MDISENTTPLIKTLTGKPTFPPPFWFMRQAGRYLPEYQKLRKQAGSFLNLCYTPRLASEVTLQPLQRFPLDAAILFADILLICQALGQPLTFKTGEGPCLTPYTPDTPLTNKSLLQHLAPIMETIALTRAKLPRDTALIGFAGAPWTVATYMIKGGSNGMEQTLHFAHHHRPAYLSLQKLLEESTITYLSAQIKAGVHAVQIFDSWAGYLQDQDLTDFSQKPLARITQALKKKHPTTPIIIFARGLGDRLPAYTQTIPANAFGIEETATLPHLHKTLPPKLCLQGNLSPQLLREGGKPMLEQADKIIQALAKRPHIFNLGHGVLPDTPPENLAQICAHIKGLPQ